MRIRGRLKFSGDKSVSHRALLMAALTDGECTINNISGGEDVESTRKCLLACGILSEKRGRRVEVYGGTFGSPTQPLDCGNSGTAARLLAGLLAGQKVTATLQGDSSLSRRPMERIIRPLKMMGASIDGDNGRLPLHLSACSLSGIEYRLPVASAQVKSSLLLAGLGAGGKTTVVEQNKTRNHTEVMLNYLGADIRIEHDRITVSRLQAPLRTFNITIPGDPSTAAFFAAAAAVTPDSELILKDVLANPTRIAFFQALEKMGTGVEWLNLHEECGEPVADLRITHNPLQAITISGIDIPRIIDELPVLAVLSTQAHGRTTVRDARELRVKECDRIRAICSNLGNMGADVSELEDGFSISGPTPLHGSRISTYGDHRIAMAFSIADLFSEGSVELDNSHCVQISCPDFHRLLNRVVQ